MDQQQWQKINAIVDTALKLDEAERTTYIEEQCAGDEQLRYRVTELLESIAKADTEDFLEESLSFPDELVADFSTEEGRKFSSSLIDETIGAYKITQLIGHGGMGSVFLAERADEAYEGTVALKVMRRGMDTPSNIARFRRERNILAGLNHPNIARLLDGGITDAELPYLVMEYVEGLPLYEYCDTHRLSIEERLDLFQAVCRVVQHAHQNAVIHRDLKPSNIMVTEEGQVKILDFGIAKLMEPEDPETTLFQTQTGARMLTLGYAAPEQVEDKPITTATDTYTLGILLYELLTGVHPIDIKEKKLTEAERLIREKAPAHPSAQLTELAFDKKATIADKRNTRAPALIQSLHGDLDAVVMKALRKEPQARYASADELINDLQRSVQNQPVMARKGTLRYKTRKYIKRHKGGLAVAAGFLLLIVGFTTFYTWQITQERNRAQRQAKKAEAVTEFLVNILSSSNPYLQQEAAGLNVTLGTILKYSRRKIGEELEGQPAVKAKILSVIGEVYSQMNEFSKAKPLLKEALAIQRIFIPSQRLR